MIKIQIEKGRGNIELYGDHRELIADTLIMIRAIHSSVQVKNKADAELYQEYVKKLVHTCFIDDVDEVYKEYHRIETEMDDEGYKIWF